MPAKRPRQRASTTEMAPGLGQSDIAEPVREHRGEPALVLPTSQECQLDSQSEPSTTPQNNASDVQSRDPVDPTVEDFAQVSGQAPTVESVEQSLATTDTVPWKIDWDQISLPDLCDGNSGFLNWSPANSWLDNPQDPAG